MRRLKIYKRCERNEHVNKIKVHIIITVIKWRAQRSTSACN